MSPLLAKLAVCGVAAAASIGAVAAAIPAAAAAPAGTFEVDYDASGSTYIAASNSTSSLGPATLTTYVSDSDGTFTGSLPLPPAQSGFALGSHLRTTATVNYIPVGPVTGKLSDTSPTTVSSVSKYTIKLTNAYLLDDHGHRVATNLGDNCKTVSPVVIAAATPKGQSFDLSAGGTLKGTYTIPKFANCRGYEHIINHHVPGPNNTVTLNVSNGRFVG